MARSFSTEAEGFGRALTTVRAEVHNPSAGLVFISGALTQSLGRVAEVVRSVWRGVPVVIAPAAGVLSERGEIEGGAAASGILWSGGEVSPLALGEDQPLAAAAGAALGDQRGTILLFARSDFSADSLEGLREAAPRACLFGAGTVGAAGVVLTPSGQVLRGRAVGLVVRKLTPIVQSTPACRLVSPLETIEETSGGLVLRAGGSPALDLLASCGPSHDPLSQVQAPHPVVFAALADARVEGDSLTDRYVVRPVRGIDPSRKGVLVGPEARPGKRLGFAIRDAAAARSGLETAAREVSQAALGSAPRFAIYLSCAGRGQGLYGMPDVESRILRQRFGDLPIAGMHSAFEIAPWNAGDARLVLYTGVLALFRSPS
jgi:small ligand-binding sensory domain FIST